MRCYKIVAGTLFSVAALFAQQTGSNVIPKGAMIGAIQRALTGPNLPLITRSPLLFRGAPTSSVCVVPLRETSGTPTRDLIAPLFPSPQIDPHLTVAPRVPVCPQEPTPGSRR
jgi:hypothetical protein